VIVVLEQPAALVDLRELNREIGGSPDTVVGVIDEGIDVNHPDLKGNIWTNAGEVAGNGTDDDRNGYVDDVNGYDFANNDATVYDPDPISGRGDEHGTHVAGIIASVGNDGIGVVGSNWDAHVASLKFLGAQGRSVSDAVEAVNYAVAEGVDISNNS
jgi:subtilisin family serine protease